MYPGPKNHGPLQPYNLSTPLRAVGLLELLIALFPYCSPSESVYRLALDEVVHHAFRRYSPITSTITSIASTALSGYSFKLEAALPTRGNQPSTQLSTEFMDNSLRTCSSQTGELNVSASVT